VRFCQSDRVLYAPWSPAAIILHLEGTIHPALCLCTAGGVWEGLPPTPPGLNLPPTRPTRRNVAPSLKVRTQAGMKCV
jgi:hypothetical protein